MVEVRFDKKFAEIFSKLDNSMKEKVVKRIQKITQNPEVGKPMKHNRKGTREVYVDSFRLSYTYLIDQNIVYVLDFYHKDEQ